jgi:hypothetical protein
MTLQQVRIGNLMAYLPHTVTYEIRLTTDYAGLDGSPSIGRFRGRRRLYSYIARRQVDIVYRLCLCKSIELYRN